MIKTDKSLVVKDLYVTKQSPSYFHLNKLHYDGKSSQFCLWSGRSSLTCLSLNNSHPLKNRIACFSKNSDLYINNALFVPASDQVCRSKHESKIEPTLQALTGEQCLLNYFHM